MPNWKFLLFVGCIIGGFYYSIKALFQLVLAIGYFMTGLTEKLTEMNRVKTRKTLRITSSSDRTTNDTINITITLK